MLTRKCCKVTLLDVTNIDRTVILRKLSTHSLSRMCHRVMSNTVPPNTFIVNNSFARSFPRNKFKSLARVVQLIAGLAISWSVG